MPELPEVETTRRGVLPHVVGNTVASVCVRHWQLRYPVPRSLPDNLRGQVLEAVHRRAKYLLFRFSDGTLILHLGMSGSLRVLTKDAEPEKHDHLDLVFNNGRILRLRDPRRFGSVSWTKDDLDRHPLLRDLGPEPLDEEFSGRYLHRQAQRRRAAVKLLIMDSHVVVGVGNIYASEALFLAGIHPARPANRIGLVRYEKLAEAIRQVLEDAIAAGGTTLRDFVSAAGSPGYFQQQLHVYGQAGEPCARCRRAISHSVLGQRATYYCGACQR